jgi:hypothetical protein
MGFVRGIPERIMSRYDLRYGIRIQLQDGFAHYTRESGHDLWRRYSALYKLKDVDILVYAGGKVALWLRYNSISRFSSEAWLNGRVL